MVPSSEMPEALQKAVWTYMYKELGHLSVQRTHELIRRQQH